jgi:hypothetical protein
VIDYLEAHQPAEKGEFESTAEYRARIANARGETQLGLVISRPYAVVLPVASTRLRYDADRGVFQIVHAPGQRRSVDILTNAGSAMVANHTADIAVLEQEQRARAAIERWGMSFNSDVGLAPSGEFAIPRSIAPAVKEHLALVVIGTSEFPFVSLSAPVPALIGVLQDLVPIDHVLTMEPAYAFLVRTDTGDILLREQSAETAPSLIATARPSGAVSATPDSRALTNTLEHLRALQSQVQAPRTPPRGGVPGVGSPNGADNAQLSAAQRGAIGDHIRECWVKDAGALHIDEQSARLLITTDAQGVVRDAQVIQTGPGFVGHAFADRVRKTLLDPQCNPLPIPRQMLGSAHSFELSFRP